MFEAKVQDVTKLPRSVAHHIYKEMTGDESEEVSIPNKERQAIVDAHFALAESFSLACGDAALLGDLRSISNASRKGSSCFEEFWSCVTEELDAMTVAAHDRRHSGVVAYLSERLTSR